MDGERGACDATSKPLKRSDIWPLERSTITTRSVLPSNRRKTMRRPSLEMVGRCSFAVVLTPAGSDDRAPVFTLTRAMSRPLPATCGGAPVTAKMSPCAGAAKVADNTAAVAAALRRRASIEPTLKLVAHRAQWLEMRVFLTDEFRPAGRSQQASPPTQGGRREHHDHQDRRQEGRHRHRAGCRS